MFDRYFPPARREEPLYRLLLTLIALTFVLCSTIIIAFDSLFVTQNAINALQVGSIAPVDIRAPFSVTYISEVLTQRVRDEAVENINPFYDPPDPNVARQQLQLLRQIVEYVDNVRHDAFGTPTQKAADINAISALTLDLAVVETILNMDDATWGAVSDEMIVVLERVMRESIREIELLQVADQLPTQVSLRFDPQAAAVVVGIVGDLIRPNRFPNAAATEAARLAAAQAISPQSRSFERGQIVVRAGARIEAADYEALDALELLSTPDRRAQMVIRAFLASLLVMVGLALYIARFPEKFNTSPRSLGLLAAVFVLTLVGARLFSGGDNLIYIFPAAAMALLLVAITHTEVAIVAGFALALLVGLMSSNSLELTMLIGVGGMVGVLILRRSERLNSYFIAGVVISLTNAIIVTLFNLGSLDSDNSTFATLILYALINGVLAAMTALAGMYAVTLLFNLPTSLKLVELSQPQQPLLQRLLRQAPGTYQHSLQVANLAEQAASAIGADADLLRVAALYHDIGKINNPGFFVENQVDNVNPHDALNDPYRSAAIIIDHVIDGDKLARLARLPARIRDFILEHHGTTQVTYFYSKALEAVGDDEAVDISEFTYPGPKPQTRETAIMMLSDSCESTVRARKPGHKSEIADIVQGIFDSRMRDGQLDECGLTLRDLNMIREIFIDMLQAVFHPRINYPASPRRPQIAMTQQIPIEVYSRPEETAVTSDPSPAPPAAPKRQTTEIVPVADDDENEESPLLEVPPLRRTQRMNPPEKEREEDDV
ncbi:MAG: HDIG domain-containing protein [Anaerolinea sp.]|nr:HDIG domain-containing protein [Anaerolinea sp.]